MPLRSSRFELLIREYMKFWLPNELVEYNVRPRWLTNTTGKPMELDMYFPRLKLAIECNGILHWVSDSQKKRDRLKADMCREFGVTLVILHKPKQIFLANKIKELTTVISEPRPQIYHALEQQIINYRPAKLEEVGKAIKQAKYLRKRRKMARKFENRRRNKLRSYHEIQKKERKFLEMREQMRAKNSYLKSIKEL